MFLSSGDWRVAQAGRRAAHGLRAVPAAGPQKKKNKKPKKKKDPNNPNSDNVIDIEEEAKNKDLLYGESWY